MALLRSDALTRTDTETIARLQALRDVACDTGRGQYVWRSGGILRRWRWVAVEAAVDPDDTHVSVIGDERTGRAFTRYGAVNAADDAFNLIRAESDAVRAATIARLAWRTRALIWLSGLAALAAYMGAAAAAIFMIVNLVQWSWGGFLTYLIAAAALAWAGDGFDQYVEYRVNLASNALRDR